MSIGALQAASSGSDYYVPARTRGAAEGTDSRDAEQAAAVQLSVAEDEADDGVVVSRYSSFTISA